MSFYGSHRNDLGVPFLLPLHLLMPAEAKSCLSFLNMITVKGLDCSQRFPGQWPVLPSVRGVSKRASVNSCRNWDDGEISAGESLPAEEGAGEKVELRDLPRESGRPESKPSLSPRVASGFRTRSLGQGI